MRDSVIIGSRAIKEYFPDFSREPKDLDIATKETVNTYDLTIDGLKIEYLKNPIILKYTNAFYLEPDLLLTLKMSHIFWQINFDKHLFDILFLIGKGAKCNVTVFNELYEYWNTVHGKDQRSDLTLNKEDFFNNALKEYDHDYLHTLINPTPTYISMLKSGAEVEIDEEKFENSTFQDKINLVQEEVYVMATERYKGLHYRVAYGRMLKKYIQGHAPLYVVRWMLTNYKCIHKPEYDFVEKIKEGIYETNS